METAKYSNKRLRFLKIGAQALKIGIGSSLAIFIATCLHLNYASSAGIITLLTILTTKWETLRLSVFRVASFVISIGIIYLITAAVREDLVWVEFGIFMFLIVLFSEWMGWKATISVNAVIGTHLIVSRDFRLGSIWNEFLLVLIGIAIAITMNLIQNTRSHRKVLASDIHYVEEKLKYFLKELAAYLREEQLEHSVWDDIIALEQHVEQSMERAVEYHKNVMYSHGEYYIHYFEMREKQTTILHNLHYEMRKIRTMPVQARVIASYVELLEDRLGEKTEPEEQLEQLQRLLEGMQKEELPRTREEFESRAMLYHILMDLEEFVVLKRRFVEGLSEEQKKIYWED